jgi:K+-transporting ATPase ATPase C chain
MFTEIRNSLRPTLVFLVLFTLICGLAYPLVITGVAQVLFPAQANGSLVSRDGKVVGSALIAQGFASDRYFHPRPSAAGKGYDATASSGSNYAPNAAALKARIVTDLAAARTREGTSAIPIDLVTTSASGLDPHISPAGAEVQVARIAKARGLDEAKVRSLVAAHVEQPVAGIFGEPRVNVLLLNLDLDRLPAGKAA